MDYRVSIAVSLRRVPAYNKPMPTATIGDALREIVGPRGVLDSENELMLYEYDGGLQRSTPQAVVFPPTTAQVADTAKLAAAESLPILARGAGTGLSGGAIAVS